MRTLNNITVIFLTGVVIKLMDDYLDQEIDRLNSRHTLALKLQRGIVPYTLLIFTFSVLLDCYLTVSLFWASYIVGMGTTNTKLPTGLKAYQEIIILLGLGFLALDYRQFLFALTIILFIQLVDDYIDYYFEEYITRDNFMNYLGAVGTFFLALVAGMIAFGIDWEKSLLIIIITPIINWLLKR